MSADAKPTIAPTYTATPYKDIKGEWRWRLTARNGRVVADSGESYKTRAGVANAIERLCLSSIVAGSFPKP